MLELSLRVAGSIPAVGRLRFIGTSCRFLLTDIYEHATKLRHGQPGQRTKVLKGCLLGGRQLNSLTTSLVEIDRRLELRIDPSSSSSSTKPPNPQCRPLVLATIARELRYL